MKGFKKWLNLFVKTTKKKGKKRRKRNTQKGGAFGIGMAAGMMAPLLMGTLGKVLKVNV